MNGKREVGKTEFVRDLRAGLSDDELMRKYDLSPRDLYRLLVQALGMGIVKPSEVPAVSGDVSDGIAWSDFRARPRTPVHSEVLIRDVKTRQEGVLRNICDRGLLVRGLKTRVRESKSLEIVCDWNKVDSAIQVDAVCRWHSPAEDSVDWKAGYEIVSVKRGDFLQLCEDLSCVAVLAPDNQPVASPFTNKSQGFGYPTPAPSGYSLGGLLNQPAMSRVDFFRFLNLLPTPCLVLNDSEQVTFLNKDSATLGEAIFQIRGRPIAELFVEKDAGAMAMETARHVRLARGLGELEGHLRIGADPVFCQIRMYRVAGHEPAPLLMFIVEKERMHGSTIPGPEAATSHEVESPGGNPVLQPPKEQPALDAEKDKHVPERHVRLEVSEAPIVLREGNGSGQKDLITKPWEDEPAFQSEAMREVIAKCQMAARSEGVVLLLGESGSGKDFLARYIHTRSPRASKGYRSINCAAIPEGLAESEFFGHESGAFTGATSQKKGLLELVPGGTVLLNEIGELPAFLQPKLLSFLDTKRFWRVGGQTELTADVRIFAATNRDLEKEVARGRFRKDLFYRLNVLPISVPPLRDRMEDLPVLIEELITRISGELRVKCRAEVDTRTMALLQGYSWPGNIRELRNRLERSIALSGGKKISFALMFDGKPREKWSFSLEFPPGGNLNDFTQEARRRLVMEALKRAQGKRQLAAKLLGITRYSLKRHMTNLGLMAGEE